MTDHIIFAPVALRRRYAARKGKRNAVHLNSTPGGASIALINETALYAVAQLDHAAIRELVAGLVDITLSRTAEDEMRQVVIDYHQEDRDDA